MSGAGCDFVQLHDAPDSDTGPASGQTDHSTSLRQHDATKDSISPQLLNQAVSEQLYEVANTDQSMKQDSLSDDFWGLGHMAIAEPCASDAVASAHDVPQTSHHSLGSADENLAQENLASLTYDLFTTPSPLPNTGWESGPQSVGSDHGNTTHNSVNPPKIGSRFSRESSKLLKQWFANHYHYPYPSKEEMKMLQHQTGLSKTQISNWLSNTRRREKMHHSTQYSQKATAAVDSNTPSINIPRRPDTPTVEKRRNCRTMGPLERWVDSPPESEPATVTAIANAVQCAESSQLTLLRGLQLYYVAGHVESASYGQDRTDLVLAKLANAVTTGWKTSTPNIRSRCGFCEIYLDSWGDRVEHLADHFKMGKTMASWTGDWGFEDAITDTLEDAIPPYLLGKESTSMFPFEASDVSPESPRTAYELLVVELSCFVETYQYKTRQLPSHEAMHIEACRIIFASEMLTLEVDAEPSWLRDLVLSNETIATQAQFLPIRTPSEGRLRTLEIRGKKSLFEDCPLEAQLYNFAITEAMANQAVISDETLQAEACKVITRMQQALQLPLTDFVFTWFMTLIYSSPTNWLNSFRQRSSLPLTASGSTPVSTSLAGHWTPGITSCAIRSHLYIGTHDFGPLRQSNGEATSDSHSIGFKHAPTNVGANIPISSESFIPTMTPSMSEELFGHGQGRHSKAIGSPDPEVSSTAFLMKHVDGGSRRHNDGLQTGSYMFHDPNLYKWLGRELGRWVTSIMSPNNPNSHVPSDEEIQHHARFLVYDDDDPWNQTVADNLEWLHRFKVSVGIVTE
ncbi:transcriptional regulator family: Homeodomain [Trichoderma harzianum]|nr:transcriptional regulator family: Homeodomain [Trichoderma harzianum]